MISVGLATSAVLLNMESAAASVVAVPSPVIAIQNAMTAAGNPVTLQWKANLASPVWQTLGTFSSSTNLSFLNAPSVFVRGLCTNPTVSVTLTWPASIDSNVVGYRVYYGTSSGAYTNSVNVGNTTTATISNLLAGTRYYFAATAYDNFGMESLYSNETNGAYQASFALGISSLSRMGGTTSLSIVQSAVPATPLPPPITVITRTISASIANPITLQYATNLSSPNWQMLGAFTGTTNVSFTNLPAVFIRGYCTNLTASVTLVWSPSTGTNVLGYKLYYGTVSHTYTAVVDAGASTTATVSNLVAGTTYYFAVTAYDAAGIQSGFSNEASGAFQVPFSLAIGNR